MIKETKNLSKLFNFVKYLLANVLQYRGGFLWRYVEVKLL